MLHDIDDWKYQSDKEKPTKRAVAFLQSESVPNDKIERVMTIIDSMGFKEELEGKGSILACQRSFSVEYGCVQDADRLDAIGAIGIARCFTYGGHKLRPLYDPDVPPIDSMTKEQYMDPNRPNTTINHFYEVHISWIIAEKAFHPDTFVVFALLAETTEAPGMMKTNAGKRLAEERHAFMETFLDQFHKEISGRG
ncbi:HD domain [Phytophthora cactorum]|nr:HD domain [Phytophthora cactorum]